MFDEVETPHKKWGKNHGKSSPNKRGCEKNNNGKHNYANFRKFFYDPRKLKHFSHVSTFCIDCGKRAYKKNIRNDDPIGDIASYGGVHYEVFPNATLSNLRRGERLGW